MLGSETLFGKRETNTPKTPGTPLGTASIVPTSAANISKVASSPSSSHATSSVTASSETAPVSPVSGASESGSRLIVGPNIKLKGVEITDCDTLVVEGQVEATIHSRVIHIAEQGVFKGSAEVDIAEIYGEFDGELIVHQKMRIHSTGRVSGKVRYGKVVIDEGGQLAGDIQVGTGSSSTRGLMVAAKTA